MAKVQAARVSDIARTALLREAIRELHRQDDAGNGAHSPLSASWALLDEVANVAGWPGGYADVIALHLWPSKATMLGYEIKASRTDLRREIDKLTAGEVKSERFSAYCSEWRLVVWDRRWVVGESAVAGIPASWGLYAWNEDTQKLDALRKATSTGRADGRDYPLAFVAALVRRAVESGAGASVLSWREARARSEGRSNGKLDERDRIRKLLETDAVLAAWRDADPATRRSWSKPQLEDLIEFLTARVGNPAALAERGA